MVTVIDYGVVNLGSMLNMLRRLGVEPGVASTAADVARAERLILPGVGAFDQGMQALEEKGLVAAIRDRAAAGVPLLGVCLGMQLLGRASEEGRVPGLGLVAAHTVRFSIPAGESLRIPHMGWNEIRFVRETPLASGLGDRPRFYFVHSYHVVCDAAEAVLAVARYGQEFTAMLQAGNVFGAQFHPEKSHRFGMQILKNFLEI